MKRNHEYEIYKCLTCNDKPEFNDNEQMKIHLRNVHKIGKKNSKFNRILSMHINGGKFHTTQYGWENKKVKFASEHCVKVK